MWIRGFSLFSLLAVLTLVVSAAEVEQQQQAAIEARAGPIVSTTKRCTTQYTSIKPKCKTVPSRTTTIRATVKSTIKKTITVNVRTIVNEKDIETNYIRPAKTVTHWTVYTREVGFLTTITRTLNDRYSLSWVTLPYSTPYRVTRTPVAKVIPAPSGFKPVLLDPANKPLPGPREPLNVKRRDLSGALAEPEIVGRAAPRYPKMVSCTKYIRTTILTTSTSTFGWRTTTVKKSITIPLPAKSTEGWWTITVNITPPGATTLTVTDWYTRNVVEDLAPTTTSYYTHYTYSSTTTITLPTPTRYAACDANNVAPENFSTYYWAAIATPLGSYISYPTNGTATDCCIACQTRPASQGKCIGSFYRSFACFWWCEEDGCWDGCTGGDPPPTKGTCFLLLGGTAGTCRTNRFFVDDYTMDNPGSVSNGPGCALWKRAPLQ